MSFKYSRYIARVTKHPWAITTEKFLVLAELFQERTAGVKLSDEEIAARVGAGASDRQAARSGNAIAVIPIHGVVAHRADSFEASSGGTSTEYVGRLLQRAVADDGVAAILLDFDTPGGSVDGVPELAAAIAAAVKVKTVVAHVNALAASAGYWLASQCSEVVCTPSGAVGSIGVFMLTVDESEALAKAGIKVNAISAGDYKLEGAPWNPLSDEAKAFYQASVDAVYSNFLSAVAKGRGVSVSDVKKNYGQGRVLDAKDALKLGMIDRIATFDDCLARLTGGGRRAAAPMAAAVEEFEIQGEAEPTSMAMAAEAPTPVDDALEQEHLAIAAALSK